MEEGWYMWWGVLSLLPLLTYYLFFFKSRNERCLAEFRGPPHHPILGIIPTFLKAERKDILPMMASWAEEYGDVIRVWSPFGSALLFTQSSSAEKLLSSATNLDKGFEYDYVRPWLGDGLLMSRGQKWGQRRKMLTPAFHFKILEDFMGVFNQEARKLVSILHKECTQQPPLTFDIHEYVTRCALDIICETAMGKSVNAQDDRDSDYIQAINEFGRLVQYRSFRPWLRYQFLWRFSPKYPIHQKTLKTLHGFTEKVIKERKAELIQEKETLKTPAKELQEEEENIYFRSKKRRLAFLDLLLEVQREKGDGELSDLDIREETDTFMFEGHDTTSANVSFTLYALGSNPHIQEKVHAELDVIFGEETEREIRTDDLPKMKYLESVIKESLRLYPSVPFIQRQLTSDLTLDDGRVVPKGSTVGLFIYQLHRDGRKFREPEVFRPDRFSLTEDEGGQGTRDPFAFVPFSAGPRNCIGQKFAMMEEKVILGTVLRKFRVQSMIPPTQLPLLSEMILKSEVGIPVRLTPRQF